MSGNFFFRSFDAHVNSPDAGALWAQYIADLEDAMGVAQLPETVHLMTLRHSIGENTKAIYNTMSTNLPNPADGTPVIETYKTAKDKLTAHFTPRKNRAFRVQAFHSAKPKLNESTEAFATRLRGLASRCDFGSTDQIDFHIIDQIVMSTPDQQLKYHILNTDGKLTDIITWARSRETAKYQLTQIDSTNIDENDTEVNNIAASSSSNVNNVQAKYRRDHDSFAPRQQQGVQEKSCGNCGDPQGENHRELCPAKDKQCFKCERTGHFSGV